ncbi:hypothetical protein AAL_02345 [Moelleriella libera RCEF 2490]|uniref:Uncharacterized protein n=1 Tax=Moelleriella libera RCEF 2490 TaxID=1081109 RepID=A0A168EHA4_9HYPO|nr:hypothetical protein AAL_02345 [Moelleriella libera RCEF 2490]
MGNLCGKQDRDASPPGRVLGTTPATPSKASVPPKVGGPPHTLGVEAGGSDARRKAAEAAEARAKASNKPGGKLQSQLAAQKKQTRAEVLKQASSSEQRAREIAQAENSRTYD